MAGISENFEEAVQKMSSVLAVTGKVIPVTLDDMQLVAQLQNGNKVYGESEIPEQAIKQKSKIKKLMIEPEGAEPLEEALEAIKEADAVVMGPGSLYTSVISNLLVSKIRIGVRRSSALKIYVSNIMTQPGETDNFKASDHIKVLKKYGGKEIVNCVVANSGEISNLLEKKYQNEDSKLVSLDIKGIKDLGVDLVEADLVKVENGFVKHDTEKLAQVLVNTIMEKKLLYDRKKIFEYMYLSQRIKEREKEEKQEKEENKQK